MRYYKTVEDGLIVAVGKGAGNIEITEEEYTKLMALVKDRPAAPEGFEYALTEEAKWELCEIPAVKDPELSDGEALKIIMGGTV